MTRPQNLVDLAREVYGPHHRCRTCGLVVYPRNGLWLDCSSSEWCWTGNTQHSGRLEGSQR